MDSGRVDGRPCSAPPSRRRIRWIVPVAAAIASAIVLAGAAGLLVSQRSLRPPDSSTSCRGTVTYSGTVTDADHANLQGVVVFLSPLGVSNGSVQTVSTNGSGGWTASVSGTCAYRAQFYWQSSVDGPLLADVSGIQVSSVVAVNVQTQTISFPLFSEFAHDPNTTISVELSAGVTISVDAVAEGDIPLGFLGLDATGRPGADFVVPFTQGLKSTVPFGLAYEGAQGYRITDVSGHSLFYLLPAPKGRIVNDVAAETLSIGEAIGRAMTRNQYPYVQVAPHGVDTTWWLLSNGSGLPLARHANVFGIELSSTFGARGNAYARFTLEIANRGSSNECYVFYREGFDFHIWYYSTHCS